ncbi:MAG: alpha/beta hydrolase [Chloroflexota bacterium]
MRHPTFSLLSAIAILLATLAWIVVDITGVEAATGTPLERDSAVQYVAADPLPTYTFVPPPIVTGQPIRLFVVLHGMGGSGTDMAAMLGPLAAQQNWAILAPTMPYRDYRDPELVRKDGELLPRLKSLIDALPGRTGLTFQSKVLFFGFSRGSQEAIRYSLMFPDLTLGVAGLSAGSYTVPSNFDAQGQTMRYPFGTGDVDTICGQKFNAAAAQKVAYFIGVGGADTKPDDVPRQWDALIGTNRLERASRFVEILQQFGARATLEIFPGAGHEVTGAMQQDAVQYLASIGS